MKEKIIIIDFGSQYSQLIARRIREMEVYCEIVPLIDVEKIKNGTEPVKGIILSGGPASVYEENAPTVDKAIFDLGLPILGICYGMQLITHLNGGKVEKADSREFGKAILEVINGENPLFKEIKKEGLKEVKTNVAPEELKKYIFIIDEINRGEISKILGELFFSIDPGYRGKSGEVATQYSNMHDDPDEKFYIPENVYIIGTMNDIDRSVDSFDFAMRRRFRFVEVKAKETQDMLESLENEALKSKAVERMDRLNAEILKVDDLNENYQIGASYFLKLKTLSFEELWTDYLKPLLQDYVRGLYDEEGIMKRFERAYDYQTLSEGNADEATEN